MEFTLYHTQTLIKTDYDTFAQWFCQFPMLTPSLYYVCIVHYHVSTYLACPSFNGIVVILIFLYGIRECLLHCGVTQVNCTY